MKKDEVRKSDLFAKYMRYINTYEDGKYNVYEFEDESGNLGIHYQLRPELLTDKKSATMARLFNTKMGKVNIGDICLVGARCREIHEEGYNQSAFYLNVDKIIYPLCKYEMEMRPYRGIMCEFAVEKHIRDWSDIDTSKDKAPRDFR